AAVVLGAGDQLARRGDEAGSVVHVVADAEGRAEAGQVHQIDGRTVLVIVIGNGIAIAAWVVQDRLDRLAVGVIDRVRLDFAGTGRSVRADGRPIIEAPDGLDGAIGAVIRRVHRKAAGIDDAGGIKA